MNTIQEIAADIARELRDDPARWTQAAYARDHRGYPIQHDAKTACTWCLMGHVKKRVTPHEEVVTSLYLLRNAIGTSTAEWNDVHDRTVQEVVELCDRIAAT